MCKILLKRQIALFATVNFEIIDNEALKQWQGMNYEYGNTFESVLEYLKDVSNVTN